MQNTVQSISHCMVESPSRRIRNAGAPTAASSTTIRRLSDTDVRSIFECLHHNMPPPTNLHFTIVPVGPNGMKLSPPSYEFAGTSIELLLNSRYLSKHFSASHFLFCDCSINLLRWIVRIVTPSEKVQKKARTCGCTTSAGPLAAFDHGEYPA